MPGIIESNIPDQVQPGAIPPSATTYEPERIQVDNATDTVEGRVDALIAKNSPLMQGAQTRANQESNSRGLLNSSMAVGASENAVYNYALPIASQDAQSSLAVKGQNQVAGNRALELGATGAQALQQIGAQGDQAVRQINVQGDTQSRLLAEKGEIDLALQTADGELRERLLVRQGEIEQGLVSTRAEEDRTTLAAQQAGEREAIELRGEIETGLRELDGTIAEKLAQTDNEYRVLLQSSQNATNFYSQISESIAAILASDIPIANKQQLIDHQVDLLDQGLRVIGGMANLDLTAFLQPTTTAPATGINIPSIPYYY
jgi:hypothetical protein